MKVLGLDTSTMMATCSVIDDNRLLGEYSLNQDMTHSEKLVPMIKEVLESLKLEVKDIDLYGVALGPGSFTGLRIGAATMKAFAHLFNKPIVGISTLEALAYNLPYNDIVVPMIDARRNRVYTGIYTWENGKIKEIMGPDVLEIEDILTRLKEYDKSIVNGDGALLHRDTIKAILKDKVQFATIGHNMCRATSICELAKIKHEAGQSDDLFTLAPDYLRPSQAERQLKDSNK
ncbi:tRNA (adenosine(37)-N6)-threonylcarbamoyltransferase complex dimerization subunit type 1 TsaB [Wansuia hejianensis]|uniref:tRNA (Adenosine(37)-N6)-threonylcarbamoyltransferase complex dimerization subunit type 1 TsaB n=1 Tax=Wansuia hejianensis TaxID=2763667 RepID=A0A926EYU4_9FIRM|nr:tRNA (adenosine(37)-N6)-threonylcarbamoyltransferase complex dimerization subunit type 1 TsaB [Wansuia hejianensis]MBC8590042.1 tRNA (adenosine(37)-N6)-threonylcarbamoyltransferase complex dimerization subunit type 1 TsaB [Wansuia hejianensis]